MQLRHDMSNFVHGLMHVGGMGSYAKWFDTPFIFDKRVGVHVH